ncbi:hypothetical protein MPTK1_4g00390 [Marchantia polymorpha subsp. ruderalis]|uniref:Saccharopine dehydrogenase NADP binding domain-containing protein n=2 Tax=Marchantia polymorpha TaxID=3197 RepID=A0AAF6B4U9_MARPO|nr:hypothetical protein MARPO_0066s0102 [Marchantia polymorpha]BBN07033.1 hypothetical protein Mp_4g00390 [Marchantia polymorpha subsp. ruderalis]|eukprot:PTQ36151.1 hypothetical protein MARPO_0066s0102 [Marchantia polymorpha]
MLHCKVTLSCGTLGLGIEQLRAVESSSYCRRRSWKVRCSNSTAQQTTVVKEDGKRSKQARVLVLGGTGRVGGSTARALAATDPAVQIVLAGRNREKGEALAKELGEGTQFSQFDFEDAETLKSILSEVDLVVHAAGPFQRRTNCNVLEAALATKTAYIDVCDDQDFSKRAKGYHQQAIDANVPAMTTTGIYPGVSNIMAAELVRLNQEASSESKPSRIRYSYYTAGTGGAGPTILATSFLLLGEEVVVYREGEKLLLKAYSGVRDVDFGKGLGKKPTYLLNLPEVASTHEVLGVPSVSARFGTDPALWNWGMSAVANFAPEGFLKDKSKVDAFVQMVDPVVRALDGIVGEKVSMRVDLDCTDGKKAVGIYTHKYLSVAVGVSIAAFARAVLEGSTQPGVWFPEEEGGIKVEDRAKLLERASKGTSNFIMNRPPWMIEKDPKEIGFGLYLQ